MLPRKKVLLTNDDGFDAPGIRLLNEILKKHYDVVVVAPDSEKSGVGHSFTYHRPLYYKKVENSYAEELYAVSGSPADCVKFAVSFLLPKRPDIIISGLNIGENSGISAHYSGTVAAAREGSFWKIKSIAFSLCEDGMEYSGQFAELVPTIIGELVQFESTLFNVNFPPCEVSEVKGIKITRQSLAFFDDNYKKEEERNCSEQQGYRIFGKKIGIEEEDDYDSRALLNNWITVTPLSHDTTDYKEIAVLKSIEDRIAIKGKNNVGT